MIIMLSIKNISLQTLHHGRLRKKDSSKRELFPWIIYKYIIAIWLQFVSQVK